MTRELLATSVDKSHPATDLRGEKNWGARVVRSHSLVRPPIFGLWRGRIVRFSESLTLVYNLVESN